MVNIKELDKNNDLDEIKNKYYDFTKSVGDRVGRTNRFYDKRYIDYIKYLADKGRLRETVQELKEELKGLEFDYVKSNALVNPSKFYENLRTDLSPVTETSDYSHYFHELINTKKLKSNIGINDYFIWAELPKNVERAKRDVVLRLHINKIFEDSLLNRLISVYEINNLQKTDNYKLFIFIKETDFFDLDEEDLLEENIVFEDSTGYFIDSDLRRKFLCWDKYLDKRYTTTKTILINTKGMTKKEEIYLYNTYIQFLNEEYTELLRTFGTDRENGHSMTVYFNGSKGNLVWKLEKYAKKNNVSFEIYEETKDLKTGYLNWIEYKYEGSK